MPPAVRRRKNHRRRAPCLIERGRRRYRAARAGNRRRLAARGRPRASSKTVVRRLRRELGRSTRAAPPFLPAAPAVPSPLFPSFPPRGGAAARRGATRPRRRCSSSTRSTGCACHSRDAAVARRATGAWTERAAKGASAEPRAAKIPAVEIRAVGTLGHARGRRLALVRRYRIIYMISLAGVVAAVLASAYAEIELTKGVKNVASALDGISDVLGELQGLTGDMGAAYRAGNSTQPGSPRERDGMFGRLEDAATSLVSVRREPAGRAAPPVARERPQTLAPQPRRRPTADEKPPTPGAATGKISTAAQRIDCAASADQIVEDFVDAVKNVNSTVDDVHGIFDDMIEPVRGRRAASLAFPCPARGRLGFSLSCKRTPWLFLVLQEDALAFPCPARGRLGFSLSCKRTPAFSTRRKSIAGLVFVALSAIAAGRTRRVACASQPAAHRSTTSKTK